MTAPAAAACGAVLVAPSRAAMLERVRRGLLALAGVSGAFVVMEPSPYELFSLLALAAFAAGGLALSAAHMPLVLLAALYNVGLTFGLLKSLNVPEAPMWVAVSWYLAATAIGFALVLAADTERRVGALLAGVTVGALIAALVGIVDWFGLLGGGSTLYGRARGTFKDPNVFGPYLVLPALVALQAALTGTGRAGLRSLALLSVFVLAVLLSFSRGAWAHFVLSASAAVVLLFLTTRSQLARGRILVMAGGAALLVVAVVAAALSIDAVDALLRERAALQGYDAGPLGRFGRQELGVALVLDYPLGIGPRRFSLQVPEDPHNVYLNAFLSGGWLAGFAYVLLVGSTLWIGGSALRIAVPWRPALIAAYGTFLGLVPLGFVVDTDHWRHFWLLVGLIWGMAIAARRSQRAGLASSVRTA